MLFRHRKVHYSNSGVVGTIHVIEAAILGDLPWDVHAYAEAHEDFPDIETGYQMMDHRDFEAYRMLGYVQTARALRADYLWPEVSDPVLGRPPPDSDDAAWI